VTRCQRGSGRTVTCCCCGCGWHERRSAPNGAEPLNGGPTERDGIGADDLREFIRSATSSLIQGAVDMALDRTNDTVSWSAISRLDRPAATSPAISRSEGDTQGSCRRSDAQASPLRRTCLPHVVRARGFGALAAFASAVVQRDGLRRGVRGGQHQSVASNSTLITSRACASRSATAVA